MQFRARFILIAFALLFAVSAHGQLTIWTPVTNDFWDATNWSNGRPDITLHVVDGADSHFQTALIQTASTAVVTATDATADQLWIGYGGSTSGLSVESGGILTVNNLLLGADQTTPSTGNATITGAGSKITGLNGAVTVGCYGTGSLTISSGGAIDTAGLLVGFDPSSEGTVTVTDSGSSVTGGIVGGSGTAHIMVTDQASVDFVRGGFGGSTTDITISGSGTSVGSVSGYNGTTHITIGNEATVGGGLSTGSGDTDIMMDTGATLVGGGITLTSGGTGIITIDSSNHSADGDIYVSGTGSNTLTLQNGAAVDASGVSAIVGDADGESGTLNITNGATLTVGNAYVGSQAGSYGEVTISGTGSDLHVFSEFAVGSAGSSNLTVSSGGSLHTDSDAYVGYSGNGSVTVAGAESQWVSGGDVHLANSLNSSGSITLADGGQLNINGGDGTLHLNTEAGGFGFLNIGGDGGSSPAAPGFLTAATVTGSGGNGGSAILVFNHTDPAYFFDPQITGEVFVVQKHGTTILTNSANDYSGGTTLMGGTLAVGNTTALGTGDINFDGGTLDLNAQSQDSGAGRLNVLSNSFIDFSAFGNSTLILADSSGITWSGTLTLLNFDGGDTFQVGLNEFGLNSAQLSLINIDGFEAMISTSGAITASGTAFTAPIPEPSTYAAFAGLAALGLAAWRGRSRSTRISIRRF
jgi:T5SS/PEP-CTERM-associated repeat protein/autotransporter-associated beta strand protein